MSGGLANIYGVAGALAEFGREVALMSPSPKAVGLDEARGKGLAILPWDTPLAPGDAWCIPESWPNSLAVGVRAGARVLVYAQSWIYLFSSLPEGVRWNTLPARFIAVSGPVAWLLHHALGVTADHILPPALNPVFFRDAPRPASHVRVAWMPRKNRALGEQIQTVAKACLEAQPSPPRVEWVSIHKLSQEDVAKELAACHLFISTGFPEGFGLPPLEAMACGCVPVGFTGFGGWEYMRQASIGSLNSSHAPPGGMELPAQDGNGFFFADGDTLGAGMALAATVRLAHENSEAWQRLSQACRLTAARYTAERQRAAIAAAFDEKGT